MLGDQARMIPGLGDLSYIDVAPGTPSEALAALQVQHRVNFPGDPQVLDEVSAFWRGTPAAPFMIVNQWLIMSGDEPVGEYIFHVNLKRAVLQRHWLTLGRSTREALPRNWLQSLVSAVLERAQNQAEARGVELLAMMSEVSPSKASLLEHWRSLGHVTPDIGYAEPLHGRSWPAFGPPVFVPMEANICVTPAGAAVPFADVVSAAVKAFYLDHYGFSPEEPQVSSVLERAAQLN